MDEQNGQSYGDDERALAAQLVEENYRELIVVARRKRRRAGLSDTMSTVDLLHESLIRLNGRTDWQSDNHFIRAAALAMRHVIVDHARKKLTAKRGSGARAINLEDAEPFLPEFSETPEQIVGISELLAKLETANPRWMRIVDARYFGGLTETETAEVLGLSERTVRRDWAEVRGWIAEQLDLSEPG